MRQAIWLSRAPLEFTLDGRAVSVVVEPGTSLLELLRDELGLRAPKDGCAPEGSCGACTVIVDDRAVVTCAQPAERVAGRTVTTTGRARDPRSGAQWADAFAADRGVPVRLLLAGHRDEGRGAAPARARAVARRGHAAAGRQPVPLHRLSPDRRRDRARGRRAAGAEPPVPAPDQHGPTSAGGPSATRRASSPSATKPFVADLRVPGMLHGALRFADHPRAVVRRIDTTRAARVPGRRRRRDRGRRARRTRPGPDPRRLAGLRRRGRDDPVRGRRARRRGGHDTRAARARPPPWSTWTYDVLAPVTDPFEALADGAPRRSTRAATCCRGPSSATATSTRPSRGPRMSSPRRSGRAGSSTRSWSRRPACGPGRRHDVRRTGACRRGVAAAPRRRPATASISRPARERGTIDARSRRCWASPRPRCASPRSRPVGASAARRT